jgi:hypothetical protein
MPHADYRMPGVGGLGRLGLLQWSPNILVMGGRCSGCFILASWSVHCPLGLTGLCTVVGHLRQPE